MKLAIRPLSINDRHYQPGEMVDTRDLPQRRVDQLKKFGALKEYDDAENVSNLLERVAALEARVQALEGPPARGDAPPQLAEAATLPMPEPSGTQVKIKRGGKTPDPED